MWFDSNSYNIDLGSLLTNTGKSNINQQYDKVTKMTNMFDYIRKLGNIFFCEGIDISILDFAGHTVCHNYSTLS